MLHLGEPVLLDGIVFGQSSERSVLYSSAAVLPLRAAGSVEAPVDAVEPVAAVLPVAAVVAVGAAVVAVDVVDPPSSPHAAAIVASPIASATGTSGDFFIQLLLAVGGGWGEVEGGEWTLARRF